MVELALALPVVCVLLAMVLQVAVLGAHRLAIELAAREGARAASLVPDRSMSAVAMSAAGRSTALGPLDVDLRRGGGLVTVTVRYDDPTDVPLAGFLLPDVELTAAVTMAVEPPSTTADTDNVAGDAAGGT